jgi:hypothetical protein
MRQLAFPVDAKSTRQVVGQGVRMVICRGAEPDALGTELESLARGGREQPRAEAETAPLRHEAEPLELDATAVPDQLEEADVLPALGSDPE